MRMKTATMDRARRRTDTSSPPKDTRPGAPPSGAVLFPPEARPLDFVLPPAAAGGDVGRSTAAPGRLPVERGEAGPLRLERPRSLGQVDEAEAAAAASLLLRDRSA